MFENDFGRITTFTNKNGIEHEEPICKKHGLVSPPVIHDSFYYKPDPEKEELLKFKTCIYCQIENILKFYKNGKKVSNDNLTRLLNALRKYNYINLYVELEDLEKIVLACISNKTFIVGYRIIKKSKKKKIFIKRDKNVFEYGLFKREIEKYKKHTSIPIINTTDYIRKNRNKKSSKFNNGKNNLAKNTDKDEYVIHSKIKNVKCPCCGFQILEKEENCANCGTKVER